MAPKLGLGTLALFLVPWYVFNSPSEEQKKPKQYVLPQEIVVTETSLPYEKRLTEVQEVKDSRGRVWKDSTFEKVVKTDDIDFSKDFEIRTDRYHFTKGKDMWVSR